MQEKVFIENKKGLKLAAVLHYPDKIKKYPGVVLLHGFTGYKDEDHIGGLAQDLSLAGFVSIRFDASGFGESEGTLADDYRMTNYLADVENVYEYFKDLNFVNPSRLGVWGQSMGGLIAIIFSSVKDSVKAIVSVSSPITIFSANGLSATLDRWKEDGFIEKISSKYGKVKLPYDFIEDSKQYNALEYIKKVKKPILVVLGTIDNTVNPDDTRTIFIAANEPKEIFEVEDMNHDYKTNPGQIRIVNRKVISFFTKNL